MKLQFKQWLEDTGQVHTTYSNHDAEDTDGFNQLQGNMCCRKKPRKHKSDPDVEKLFGKRMKKK
jgi:hypothetical protein